jgi:hypothetical protein
LRSLISSTKKDDPTLPVLPAIDPVASAYVNSQLCHALTDRLRVAQIAGFNLAESGSDANLGHFVAKTAEPFCIRFASILLLVADEFDQESKCSIKATIGFWKKTAS